METPKTQRISTFIPQTPIASRSKPIFDDSTATQECVHSLSTPTASHNSLTLSESEQSTLEAFGIATETSPVELIPIYTNPSYDMPFYDEVQRKDVSIKYKYHRFYGNVFVYVKPAAKGYIYLPAPKERIICGIGCNIISLGGKSYIHVSRPNTSVRFMIVNDMYFDDYKSCFIEAMKKELEQHYCIGLEMNKEGTCITFELFDGISAMYYVISRDSEDEDGSLVRVKTYPNVWNGKCKFNPQLRYEVCNSNIEEYIHYKLTSGRYSEEGYNEVRAAHSAQHRIDRV